MGRSAKPVNLLLFEGKTHLTKAQVQKRKAAEIHLNNQTIRADPLVMEDERALQEFKFLQKLYKEIEFVGTLDSHIISQYCLSVAELDDLLFVMEETRRQMRGGDPETKRKALAGFLTLDTELRLKRAEIVKLSDRLYLNPVARTKNLPRREEEPPEQDKTKAMFGG